MRLAQKLVQGLAVDQKHNLDFSLGKGAREERFVKAVPVSESGAALIPARMTTRCKSKSAGICFGRGDLEL